jgi:aryl-phospho-beta-D-glucosidase BglC (GH1 family)
MPQPTSLSCPGGLTIAASDVVSDFAQPAQPYMYKVGSRGGTFWYAFGADDMNGTPGASTPGVGSNLFQVDTTVTGPCGGKGALEISSTGNTGYGIGFGVNLVADAAGAPGVKQPYSAMADGYTGIGFYMKCQAETQFVFFKVPDVANDAGIASPTCSYTGAGGMRECNAFGIKNAAVESDWTHYQVYFSEALQDPSLPSSSYSSGVDPTQLTSIQLQVNSQYTVDKQGNPSTAFANPFQCWLADVHFIKTPAPTSAPPSGHYSVSGNKFLDPSGATVRLKGVGRPSLEWDVAGFNVTREDFARMKAWGSHVNAVRISLNQGIWLSGHGAYSSLYAKYVDRAVQWALEQGLAVILDLHWNEGTMGSSAMLGTFAQQMMADQASITFWQQLAAKYKNDGRVIFELYNEPHDIPVATWKSGDSTWAGMQQLYNAVRTTAGANNLVLLGGLDWSYDLHQVVGQVSGTNIGYVTHPYAFKNSVTNQVAFITPAQTAAVIATEFGDYTCTSSDYTSMLGTLSSNGISYTAYAWYENGCSYPSLISNYSGSPLMGSGSAVQSDLNQP